MMARRNMQGLVHIVKKPRTAYNTDTKLTAEGHMPKFRLNSTEFQILMRLFQDNSAALRHLETKLENRISGLETKLENKMQAGFDKISADQKHSQMILLGAIGLATAFFQMKDATLPQLPFFNSAATVDSSNKPSPPDVER